MTILTFAKYERPLIIGLFPFLLMLLLQLPIFAQEKVPEEGHASNIKWTTRGDIIVINYDLSGGEDSKFEVTFTMKKDNDTSFAVVPRTIDGDIGGGIAIGSNHEAQWYYRRDYPLGFSGKGYYFEVQVKKMEFHSNLIYYIAGGVALAGGIIAIIASKNQPSGPPPPGDLPYPPVRP